MVRKSKAFLRRSGKDSNLTIPIQHGSSSQVNRARKGNKSIQKRKEEINLSQFADGMVFYIKKKSQGTYKKLLELISEFSKVISKSNISTQYQRTC